LHLNLKIVFKTRNYHFKMNQKGVYTLEYLCENYGFAIRNLRESIGRGELIASKIGKAYFVTESNFVTWVESKKVNPSKVSAEG
jgi:hypothetical protein